MDPLTGKRPVGRPKLRGCDYTIAVNDAGVAKAKCSLTKKSNVVAEQCVMSDKGRCSLKKAPKAPKKVALNGCMVTVGAKGDRCVRDKDSDEIDERCMKNEKGRCSLKKAPKAPKAAALNGCMVKASAKGDRCVRNKDSDEIDERCMKNEKGRCSLKKAPKAPKSPKVAVDNIRVPTLTLSIDMHLQQVVVYAIMNQPRKYLNMKGKEVTIPDSVTQYAISKLDRLRVLLEENIANHNIDINSVMAGSNMTPYIAKNMSSAAVEDALQYIPIETVRSFLTAKLRQEVSDEEAHFYRVVLFTFLMDLIDFSLNRPMMTSNRTKLSNEDIDVAISVDEEFKKYL
jgi:hypothetical protein